MHWLPPNGALHGIGLDRLLNINLAIVFWLFVAAQALLVLALLRLVIPTEAPAGRAAEGHAFASRALLVLDYAALAALTGLYVWMLASSHHLWTARRESIAATNAVKVEVTGVQFQWYFRYPGTDGVYGRTLSTLINAPAGNPLGLDPTDPRSTDDIVSPILVLPVNRPIDITLRSRDVIHGFFIPGMRLKQDAIPGMIGHLQFTPIATGDYPILCSQVCGLGHARMQSRLRVVSPSDYDHWLAAREQAALANAASRQSTLATTP